MALPTKGRVIIETTFGEIDIELWAKETPRACRNFIALALEGYYDGVIFHRIVPGFLAQTGDRTGTGNGGESFFGEPFEDEIHPRLRYTHRGLVGMANNGTRNSNDSQFFLTLDRADELHGKHTLFGRVVGDTIYNVMKLSEMEIDKDNRPVYPPKIKSIKIVDNPFNDIIPRITAAERRAQHKAKEEAQRNREEEMRRRSAKKNTKLLSFVGGGDENDEEPVTFKKKPNFRPDLVDDPLPTATVPDFVLNPIVGGPPPAKAKLPKAEPPTEEEAPSSKSSKKKDKKDKEEDISKIREKHAKEQMSANDQRKAQIEAMEADIRKMTRRLEGASDDESASRKKPKKSYLEEELAKYSNKKGLHAKKGGREGKGKRDESDVLAALDGFRDKLRNQMDVDEDERGADAGENEQVEGEGEQEPIEVDDDFGFLTHSLHFPKGNAEEEAKAEREYEVIDPRARGAKAREEERERRKEKEKKEKNVRGAHYRPSGHEGHRDRERDRPRR